MSDQASLFVARHAPVAVDGICYGQSDVPTRIDADAACEALCEEIARGAIRVDRIWSSPWRRTREPACKLAERLHVPLEIDGRISELAFGLWEGRRYAELETDAAFCAWMKAWRHEAPPGGERVADLMTRVCAWHADIRGRAEVALAVTHAGVIRALRADARGRSYDEVVGEPVASLRIEAIDGSSATRV
jgi:alpha-ribazole phosphatase